MHYHATNDSISISTATKPSPPRSPRTASATNGRWTNLVDESTVAADEGYIHEQGKNRHGLPITLYLQHRLLLEEDSVDQDSRDEGRGTLLQAASNGHKAVVKLLLANDQVDVNAKDSADGQTPLWRAVKGGHEAVVKLLLANDRVDVNAIGSWLKETPLERAVENGHEAIVKLLLANDRVDVNRTSSLFGPTPLSRAVENGHEAIVKLLLANDRVDVNCTGPLFGPTPLLQAVNNGHEAIVKLLLANDRVDVNRTDPLFRSTPLLQAVNNGHEAIVKLLLTNDRVDVNRTGPLCASTPLLWAAENGHEAIVKLLLADDRVDVNRTGSWFGQTPLSLATKNGHKAVVKLLRRAIADLNAIPRPENAPPDTPIYLIMVWHIIQFLMFLARRLQTVLQINLSLDRLSEFPNRLRPPCTTMPWNVRPALVVLWGVCWMFYSRPTTPQPGESHAIWGSGLPSINSDNSFYDIPYETNQFQHFLNPFDQPLDSPRVTLEDPFQQTLGFETSAVSASPNAWLASLLEGQDDFEQVETSNVSPFQAPESSEQTTMQPLAPAAGTIQNDWNGSETFIAVNEDPTDTIQQPSPNNLLQLSMAVSSRQLTQSNLLTTLPTTQAASNQVARTVALSQTSTNIDQSAQPPQNSESRMICDRVGCGNITFPRRSDWEKHMNKHDRPYKCTVADCTHSNGFSSKGDLERHKRAKHKQLLLHEAATRPSNLLHYCPELSCHRSSSSLSNNPFTRKDHLQEHIKRKHKDLLPNHPASMPGGNPTADTQYILNSNLSGLGSPAGQFYTAVPSTGKRRRLEKRALSLENADEPREETEGLRRKVRDLERKVESYEKTVEALLDVIRNFTKQAN